MGESSLKWRNDCTLELVDKDVDTQEKSFVPKAPFS